MSAPDPTLAACLTPPAAGGVAVIQVSGPDAPALVGRHLVSRNPLDLATLPNDQLRLCRFMDGAETIDDVLVCVRRHGADDSWVVDLTLHGGPRIVQRVLMVLRQDGARIAAPLELLPETWNTRDALELEAIRCLLTAQTRDMCRWLLRAHVSLREALNRALRLVQRNDPAAARDALAGVLSTGVPLARIPRGVRIVVTGRPNAGKSTLVNRLAEREQILVSPVAGTTRDYVEQPCAIDGLPMLLVDTAGMRETPDVLEREAMARARQQMQGADLILHLVDAACPPDEGDAVFAPPSGAACGQLLIWNKTDLAVHPAQQERMARLSGLSISAATGEGIVGLREEIVEALGFKGWRERLPAVFTDRQKRLLVEALRGLSAETHTHDEATQLIHECLNGRL